MAEILQIKKTSKEEVEKKQELIRAENIWVSISPIVRKSLEMSLNDSQVKCIIQYKNPSQDFISIKSEIQKQTLIPVSPDARSQGIYLKKDDEMSLKSRLANAKRKLLPPLSFIKKTTEENCYLEVTFKRGFIIWVNQVSGSSSR